MNYAKPEVISLASANSVIQGTDPIQKMASSHDSKGLQGYVTIAAYESDE
jgi:hypothetical protein